MILPPAFVPKFDNDEVSTVAQQRLCWMDGSCIHFSISLHIGLVFCAFDTAGRGLGTPHRGSDLVQFFHCFEAVCWILGRAES